MDNAVSQKGTKTRTRQATHGSHLVSRLKCPFCGCSQINRSLSTNGRRAGEFWCGACAAFFDAPAEEVRP